MTNTVQVKERRVNGRDVIAFTKTYNDEEHEVFAPREQANQILLDLLATVNDSKENDEDGFVLVRKSELGYVND